jgi:hypothetical protein
MQMVIAKPPLQDMNQVKKLCDVMNRATGAGILIDDNGDVTFTNATKQCMETANNKRLLTKVAKASD